jgi:hypothetical protein
MGVIEIRRVFRQLPRDLEFLVVLSQTPALECGLEEPYEMGDIFGDLVH